MKKSILIVGNGPSSTHKKAQELSKGSEVVRLNWFFMEKELLFGKDIDYMILSLNEPILILCLDNFRIKKSN